MKWISIKAWFKVCQTVASYAEPSDKIVAVMMVLVGFAVLLGAPEAVALLALGFGAGLLVMNGGTANYMYSQLKAERRALSQMTQELAANINAELIATDEDKWVQWWREHQS